MEYVCKVGTPGGEVVERAFAAADESSLRAELEQQGYYLFAVRRGFGFRELTFRQPRVDSALLLVFCQELAALLKAGLPLYQSLDVMLERQRDPLFRRSLGSVRERVKAGSALSDAFKAEAQLYPAILSASLVAGERSGNLEAVLRRFVQYLRLNQALKKKAIAASIYPALIFTMMAVLVTIMLVWVIPQFESFYEGLNAQLPLATRLLIFVSKLIAGNIVWLVIAATLGIASSLAWWRREGSGVIVDGLLLRLPYFGPLMRMYATSQLARTLATLLSGGLPLLNALEVASASIGNRALAAGVAAAAPLVREGKSLTTALEATAMVDNLALEMVKVGEQTGGLAEMLSSLAEFLDEELETKVATLLALVEPLMLVLLAIIVAAMLLAFYLPMFQAISAVQRGGS
jgi:type IV pilus assembly protein PilC